MVPSSVVGTLGNIVWGKDDRDRCSGVSVTRHTPASPVPLTVGLRGVNRE